MSRFARDTAVHALGDGRFAAELSTDWSAPNGPNGGYLAAIVLRALTAAVDDPARVPRSLTVHYLRPPTDGPAELEVVVERSGRRVSFLRAQLAQEGRTVLTALAVFAVAFEVLRDWAVPPPAVAPPEDLAVLPRREGMPAIFDRLRLRPALGPPPFGGGDEALAGGWMELSEPHPLDPPALALYCDAWLPAVFGRLTTPAPVPTLDLTIHFRAALPLAGEDPAAPVLGIFGSATSAEGFVEEDGRLSSRGGVLLAQSRQLALLPGGRPG